MKQMENSKKGTSCWNCKFNDLSGNTFLGICTWFAKHEKGQNKEIPPEVVDVGCKYFTPRNA
jgi:hypothetical protein